MAQNDIQDLKNRFGYHAPKDDTTKQTHRLIRSGMYLAAVTVMERVPPGREQSLALTKIEEAMMWANAGIARVGPLTEDV